MVHGGPLQKHPGNIGAVLGFFWGVCACRLLADTFAKVPGWPIRVPGARGATAFRKGWKEVTFQRLCAQAGRKTFTGRDPRNQLHRSLTSVQATPYSNRCCMSAVGRPVPPACHTSTVAAGWVVYYPTQCALRQTSYKTTAAVPCAGPAPRQQCFACSPRHDHCECALKGKLHISGARPHDDKHHSDSTLISSVRWGPFSAVFAFLGTFGSQMWPMFGFLCRFL